MVVVVVAAAMDKPPGLQAFLVNILVSRCSQPGVSVLGTGVTMSLDL